VRSAHPADWAALFVICHEGIEDALAMAGAILNDVIQRRSFTIASAEQNRPYGEGPAWFKDSWPVSMGCRIGLASVDRAGMLAASHHQRSGRTCISIQISPIYLSSTIRWYSIS
tara:strand:+ start:58 stop:399 length:342 start_codon:yes stop_codon:yes gene_type:complete